MSLRTVRGSLAALLLTTTPISTALAQDSNPPAPADESAVPLPTLQVDTTKEQAPKKKTAKKKSTSTQPSAAPAPSPERAKSEALSKAAATSPPNSFVADVSSAATKTDTPILETPQSISVITSDQMQTRGVTTVVEALQYTPGIYTHAGGKDPRFDSFKIRGFSSQGYGTFRDGLKELGSADFFGHFRNESYGMERIDVIRGPSSVLYGQTAPGGLINIVTKRPTEQTLREFVGTIGTDERFQGAFDFSGAVDEEGKLLFRLTGVVRDADAQVAHFSDFVEDDRLFLAPSFTLKPDDDTTLTVLTDFQHDETGNAFAASIFYPFYGGTEYVKATKLFTGDPNYDKFEQDQFRVGYLFEHRFDDAITVRQNLRYGETDIDYQYLLGGVLVPTNTTVTRFPRAVQEHTGTFVVDNQLQANLATGAINHTIVSGVDYQQLRLDDVFYFDGTNYPLELANPVYGINIPRPTAVALSTKQKATQTGIYAQDQAKIDNWVLTFGGRYDWAELDTLNRVSGTRTTKSDEAFTGRVGLTYVFDVGLAPYISYSDSFLPTTSTDASGDPFDPSTSQQYEAGIKYEFGRELRATLAVFDITQQNVLTADPVHTGFSVQTGEVRSRGFEAEVVATLAQGFKLTSSYTAMDVEVTKTNKEGELGNVPILTPEQMASFYADYTFQHGPLAGFGLGFGARYIGKTYQDITNNYSNDAYTVFDAGVHYAFDESTLLQVNASNIFAKEEAICSTNGGCQWISPRIVNAELRYRW